MIISFSKHNQLKWYTVIIISLFVLGEQVRRGIFEPLSLNFLFVGCVCALLVSNRKNLYWGRIVIITVLIMHATWINFVNDCAVGTMVRCIVVYYIPLFLICINYKIDLDYYEMAKKCIKLINSFMIFITTVYCIDMVAQGIIMKILSRFLLYTVSEWIPSSLGFFTCRYPSYMGHYLFTGELFIVFFVLNYSFYLKTKTWVLDKKITYLVYAIGTLSTGSKFCTFTMLIMFCTTILFEKNKRFFKFAIVFGGILVLYFIGIFDFVISRLGDGSDLTTGRADAWLYLYEAGALEIELLNGYGMNIENVWTGMISHFFYNPYTAYRQASIALEYPLVANVYRYGIVNTGLVVSFMFIVPVVEFLKKEQIYLAIYLSVIFIDINTFNLLMQGMDAMSVYVLVLMILKFISKIDCKKV